MYRDAPIVESAAGVPESELADRGVSAADATLFE